MNRLLFIFLFTAIFAKEKTTSQVVFLSEPLHYQATVSSGKVSYIAYIKDSEQNRPITFAFNGGPGASSCYLHLCALGPRRILGPEEGASIQPPYEMVDNLETILDFTDLVFIDPSGTGFSELDEDVLSIEEDIESVGTFIRDYLTEYKRWNSPKYIAGESYGATRAIGIVENLQKQHGIYFNGLILISAAIDYQTFIFDVDNQLPYFLYLPTYATTAWYHQKAHRESTLDEVVEKAKNFIYQTYAPTLICPPCKDIQTLYPELAQMTGLPLDVIDQNNGKLGVGNFIYSLLSDEHKMVGRFDTRISGTYEKNDFQDPSISQIDGVLSALLHEYLHKELHFKRSYTLFSDTVNEKWKFTKENDFGYPNLMGALRRALVQNPSLKIFVGAGYFDLATPFLTMEYCMNHLAIPNVSLQMEYYEGGHMYYLNPAARKKFKQDLTHFYR